MRPHPSRVASKHLASPKPGWLDGTAEATLGSLLTELSQEAAVTRLQEACRYAVRLEMVARVGRKG